jgi:hypothetical protein
MIEFINQPVTVEGQRRPDGIVRPLAFVWHSRRYAILSWGRESTETRQGRTVYCHLVRTAAFETWELCQDKETAQWTLTRHWARKFRAV